MFPGMNQAQGYVFLCSTQLNVKFTMLINVKMPIIGILTFISMTNTTSESFEMRSLFFSIFLTIKISCSVEQTKNQVDSLRPGQQFLSHAGKEYPWLNHF